MGIVALLITPLITTHEPPSRELFTLFRAQDHDFKKIFCTNLCEMCCIHLTPALSSSFCDLDEGKTRSHATFALSNAMERCARIFLLLGPGELETLLLVLV